MKVCVCVCIFKYIITPNDIWFKLPYLSSVRLQVVEFATTLVTLEKLVQLNHRPAWPDNQPC